MSEPTLDEYLHLLTSAPSAAVRANAAWRLGRMRDMRALASLLVALHDEAAGVRVRVVEALGMRRDAEIVPALLGLLDDPDEDVRAIVTRSLGGIDATVVTPVLIAYLHDPSPLVRAEVAQALGNSHDDALSEPLVATFIDDTDANVRHFARQSLSQFGGARVIAALIAALDAHTDDPGIMIDVMEVLAMLRAHAAREHFRVLSEHDDEDVQQTARWALGLVRE